jgi:hypothetical protein
MQRHTPCWTSNQTGETHPGTLARAVQQHIVVLAQHRFTGAAMLRLL